MDEQTKIECIGRAARTAAQHFAASSLGQPGYGGKHVIWTLPYLTEVTPLVFMGTLDECEAWIDGYVWRAIDATLKSQTAPQGKEP